MKNKIEILEEIEKIMEVSFTDLLRSKEKKKEGETELSESKHLVIFSIGFNSMRHCINRIKRLNELLAPYDHLRSDCLWNDLFECFYALQEYIGNHEELSSEKQIQVRLTKMNSLFLQLENDATLKKMLAMARCSGSTAALALRMIQNTHTKNEMKKK